MQDSASSTQSSWKGSRWIMWGLIIIVSLISFVRVFAKWHAYEDLTRAIAIVFALLLFVFPVRLMLNFRSGSRRMEIEQVVVFAYIILLLVTTFLR